MIVLAILSYLAAGVLAAAVLHRVNPEWWDDLDHDPVLDGLFVLLWPCFVGTAVLVALLWCLGAVTGRRP